MGKTTGFLEYHARSGRAPPGRRAHQRLVRDLSSPSPKRNCAAQGARCMDCGVPFCHTGCPLTNIIPDWNDLVYRGRWREAMRAAARHQQLPRVHRPHLPGALRSRLRARHQRAAGHHQADRKDHRRPRLRRRLDPARSRRRSRPASAWPSSAPDPPAWPPRSNWRAPATRSRSSKRTTASAACCATASPTSRWRSTSSTGAWSRCAPKASSSRPTPTSAATSRSRICASEFDAILLAGGAEQPRDLNVPGRELKGIHFAMEFLPQQNRRCEGDTVPESDAILATGKRVVIIGGGDTGADCLGTSPPPEARSRSLSSSCCPSRPTSARRPRPGRCGPCNCASKARTKKAACAIGASPPPVSPATSSGNVKQLHAVRVGPPPKFEAIAGTEFTIDADLVLLAMGFLGPVKNGMIEQLGVELDARGNVAADDNYMSSRPGRLRRRRHAPRPVAGGLGHRRRPQSRAGHRPLPHRRHQAGVGARRGIATSKSRPAAWRTHRCVARVRAPRLNGKVVS